MDLDKDKLYLLGLSRSELAVFNAVRIERDTPLLIAKYTRISRPAVYEIIDRLHARGLLKSFIRNGKKYWKQATVHDLELALYETKKQLFGIAEGVEEVRGLSDSMVVVHRGKESIRLLIQAVFRENRDARIQVIQGDAVAIGWNKLFGDNGTNEINNLIKKNRIIVESVLPYGWFERHIGLVGKSWIKNFEGRMAVTHEIDGKYFDHGGQIWIFKNSIYFVAMNEEIIIEVRSSEIQKVILAMFKFVQDNSSKFDVNARLHEILADKNI